MLLLLISLSLRSLYCFIGPPTSLSLPECTTNVHLLDPFGSPCNGQCCSSPPHSRSEYARASCTVSIYAHRAPSALICLSRLEVLVSYANPFPSVPLPASMVTMKPEGVIISTGPLIFFGQDDSCPDWFLTSARHRYMRLR